MRTVGNCGQQRDKGMKLWIWSDVHHELQEVDYPSRENAPECDLIIIAGDLNAAPDLHITLEFLIRRFEKPIIYVPGNHEFYQNKWLMNDRERSLESDRQTIKAIEALSQDWPQRFYCLDQDEVINDNIRFVGASLWVDFQMKLSKKSDLAQRMQEARAILNDFRAIRMETGKLFTPQDMLDLHLSDAAYIRQNWQNHLTDAQWCLPITCRIPIAHHRSMQTQSATICSPPDQTLSMTSFTPNEHLIYGFAAIHIMLSTFSSVEAGLFAIRLVTSGNKD